MSIKTLLSILSELHPRGGNRHAVSLSPSLSILSELHPCGAYPLHRKRRRGFQFFLSCIGDRDPEFWRRQDVFLSFNSF